MQRKITVLVSLIIIVGLLSPAQTLPAVAGAPIPALAVGTSASVMFIQNVGQFADGARFQMLGGDQPVWLAEDAIWITVLARTCESDQAPKQHLERRPGLTDQNRETRPRRAVNLRLSLVGANPHPRLEPFGRLETRVSYFMGSDSQQWHPDVPV